MTQCHLLISSGNHSVFLLKDTSTHRMQGSEIGPTTFRSLDDHATTWATAVPFVFTHISLSLFLAVSLHFWFSPYSDPVEMVSRCRCNSFASTYVSCTNTAKKKPWRKCRPHIAWQDWLKIVLSDVLLRLTYKKTKQNRFYTENTQKWPQVNFPESWPFPYSLHFFNS